MYRQVRGSLPGAGAGQQLGAAEDAGAPCARKAALELVCSRRMVVRRRTEAASRDQSAKHVDSRTGHTSSRLEVVRQNPMGIGASRCGTAWERQYRTPGKGGRGVQLGPAQPIQMPIGATSPMVWPEAQKAAFRAICDFVTGQRHWDNEEAVIEGILCKLGEHPLYFGEEEEEIIANVQANISLLWEDDPKDSWE